MEKPAVGLVLKTAIMNSIREMLYLTLWWYSTGLSETFGKLLRSVKGSVRYFGADVWARNLFVPMYGDESITGRAISFLVRIVVLFFRSLCVFLWVVIALGLALIYLVILPVSIIGLTVHFFSLLFSYA